jgi:hypothetical protein
VLNMLIRLALAGFLLAHAAIHVAFLAPAPAATAGGPTWPFTTTNSWLLSRLGIAPEAAHLVAMALVAVTIAGFALAALSAIGILPASMWLPAIAIGAASSIGLLIAFFHPWLVLGIGIDLVLVWVTVVTGWTPVSTAPQV